MEQRNCNIAFRGMIGGASLIFLVAAGILICTSKDAYAQATEPGGMPAAEDVTPGDTSSDGNLDVPAATADYDAATDARSVAEADPDIGAVAGTDSVLELPQVVDPASYAVAAPAGVNPAPADSNAALASTAAVLPDSDSALSDANDGGQTGSIADNATVDGASSGPMSDAQDYQHPANSGPVMAYAAPVFVEPAPAYHVRMPEPAPLILRAGANDQRPIADVLRPQAGELRHFQVGTGVRFFNSRRGQGIVIPHGPMAMAGRCHRH
jgi:hypothetical protein